MQLSRRVSAFTRMVVWATAIAAFMAVSAPKIFRGVSRNSIQFAGPFHSTDNFLNFETGARNGSERLIALFASMPPSKEIVIFIRGDDKQSSFLGMVVAYLAWPHPVKIVDLKQADGPAEIATTDSVAAVAFCHVKGPPWWPRGELIGDALEISPIKKAK